MRCSRLHTELYRIARGVSGDYDVTCLQDARIASDEA